MSNTQAEKPMTREDQIKQWKDVVAKNADVRAFLPEKLQKDAEKLFEMQRELARKEAELGNFSSQLWMKVRKELDAAGYKDIWSKNLGIDKEARKLGLVIINIRDEIANGPGGMM
jgi:Zn-dependent M32 family carboxypeptidase